MRNLGQTAGRLRRGLALLLILLLAGAGCSSCTSPGKTDSEAPAAEQAAAAETAEKESTAAGQTAEREPFPFTDAGSPPSSATVMVYLTGSDLEAGSEAATQDLREMAESGIDLSRTQLLVYTGGAPVWHSENPEIPTDANVVYLLTKDGFTEVTRFEQLSMGEPESLSRFLRYCHDNYPARAYDLILWDHGNGPVMGYGSDRQYNGDSLTLPEMQTALQASPFGPDEKLALVGFDACLMSSAELMFVWSDYADLLVASQELEPSMGWHYSFLKNVCKVSPRALAKEIVDDYMAGCEEFFADHPLFQSDLTLAVLDLTRADELETSLNTLFDAAAEDVSGDFNKLAVARVRSHSFARAGSGSEYDLVDLESLLTGMEEKYPEQTAAVREVLDGTVVYRDSNISESCGLSLFYPYYNKKYYQNQWKEGYRSLGCLEDYASFLDRYEQVWLGTDLKDLFEGELRPKEGGAATYTMELTEQQLQQYAKGGYYILRRTGEGSYAIVYVSNAVEEKNGVLTAVFDGRIIYVSDNFGYKSIPIVRAWETVGDMTDYTILGVSAERDDPDTDPMSVTSFLSEEVLPVDLQLAVNTTDGSLTVKGIYARDEEEEIVAGKRTPVLPEDWKLFSFYNIRSRYLLRGDDGHILPFWDWPEGDWITWSEYPVVNGLNFTYEPLYDDGYEYYIMFEVIDVQGNEYASELLPITLEPAPEEEASAESTEILWEEGRSVTLLDEEGVKLDLTLDQSHDSGRPLFGAEADNGNDYPILVKMEDLVLDQKFSCSSGLWLTSGAHEEARGNLSGLSELLAREGRNCPQRLDFTLTVENYATDGYVFYKRPFTVLFSENVEPESLAVPMAGASARRQTLEPGGAAAAGPVEVELLGLGLSDPSAYSKTLAMDLRLHNTSSAPVEVHLGGLSLNGLYYSLDSRYTLGPDAVLYTSASIRDYQFLRDEEETLVTERANRIESISSVSLLFGQDGKYEWYPVTLAEKGDQAPFTPEGTLLCEEDGIRIYAEQPSPSDPDDAASAPAWPVWIENTTDRPVQVVIYDTRETATPWFDYYITTTVGPGTVKLEIMTFNRDLTELSGDLAFYAEIRAEGRENDYTTGTFRLPLP